VRRRATKPSARVRAIANKEELFRHLALQSASSTLERTASMKLSPEGIKEFRTLLKEEYGVDLTEGEAGVLGVQTLLLYELIHQPLPNEQKTMPPVDPEQGAR
jgi:hypothetical protein